MVGNGMTGRFAALVAAGIVLGAPLGAVAQQPPVVMPGGVVPTAEDEALWGSAQALGTAEAYRDYLTRFPAGAHVPEARARLGQLLAGSRPVATTAPAAPAATLPGAPAPVVTSPVVTPPAATAPGITAPPPPAPVTSSPLTPATEVPPAQSPAQAARAEVQAAEGSGTEATLNLSLEDRRAIQSRLSVLGYDTRGVDGVFGSGTRRAIRDWQTAQGDAVTGYLTAAQVRTLRGGTSAPAVPVVTPGRGATAEDEARLDLGSIDRTEVQSRLSALGYDPNGIDGRFGPGTRRAISAWQGDNGLAATGYLNADQLSTLRAQRRN